MKANPNRPAFYDHAHYIASLSIVYATMHECGDIEHTNDWDWWVGITLRDGTRLGDSSWVIDPITDHTDEAQIQVLEKSEDEHGYCDTFTVPLAQGGHFLQSANPDELGYAGMAVHLERWIPVSIDGADIATNIIRCDQIASIHIGQR